ncbi:class I SAM-dependent methyltransferase [Solibaculum mannosilyticum]|uniref:Methyltransferase n=1 Tax=Solibaculum mannosilyticum TaxID=2780922 RepID=A0A7I8D2K9_9FIRM|nr:class I SAM-dependent methyltransferase [Solibaculum mannosilyticum]BCI61057.1 methyltransferase [Solibaculum mannosilyticum]
MKENKYDQDSFFEKYSQMTRSRYGLSGAGEWSAFRQLLPDFKGKRVLDLGCGYGWHCAYAVEHGASSVLGIDLSHKMLQVAREKNNAPSITYRQCAIEDFNPFPSSFDVVISSLAFHYVKDWDDVVRLVHHSLVPNGQFIFSVEHPVFTAAGSQDWFYRDNGDIAHFPVDNYFYEGKRQAVFLGERVVKYHRTLTTYLDSLLKHGFFIHAVVEPQPPEDMMHLDGMKDEMRRPMMILISAQKNDADNASV